MNGPNSNSKVIDFQRYFETTPVPHNLSGNEAKIIEFVEYHRDTGRKIAVVTSGGTTVPLENQTVRFLDNFSAGTRGAASAEYLIENDYAVIFMHRQFSLQPFARHYSHSTNFFFDLLTLEGDDRPAKELTRRASVPLKVCIEDIKKSTKSIPTGKIIVAPKYAAKMTKLLQKYRRTKTDGTLVMIDFVTITDYLFLLRSVARIMQPLGPNVMFFLAAAVSDFFIPHENLAEHKIQSGLGNGKLNIHMDPVPKILKQMVESWVPSAFVASFKLETDSTLLIPKCKDALDRYGHQVVIGNMLNTRKTNIVLISKDQKSGEYHQDPIEISHEQVEKGIEIESILIPRLKVLHMDWISRYRQKGTLT